MTDQVISGYTTSYTDPGSGIFLPAAWIQIRQINYLPYYSCLVITDVYTNEDSYRLRMAPVFYNIAPLVVCGTGDWNNYFDPSIMNQLNKNIQTQSILWLQTRY